MGKHLFGPKFQWIRDRFELRFLSESKALIFDIRINYPQSDSTDSEAYQFVKLRGFIIQNDMRGHVACLEQLEVTQVKTFPVIRLLGPLPYYCRINIKRSRYHDLHFAATTGMVLRGHKQITCHQSSLLRGRLYLGSSRNAPVTSLKTAL